MSVAAGSLTSGSVSLSDPRPGQASVSYTFKGSSADGATAVKCVQVVWSTTPTGDTAPAGFSGASGSVNAGASTLINSSASGWSLTKSDGAGSTGQNNIYQYTNATGVTPSTTTGATFVLSTITNPNTADTAYYFKLNTYGNTNCSSAAIDNATVGFINTNGSTLSLTVDANLSFSVSGVNNGASCDGATTTGTSTSTTIPFGAVSTASNSVVCQDLVAATNAPSGYTISLRYTGAPQNATSDTIADHSGSNASPSTFSAAGTEAYGYTTDDATLGTGTAGRFTAGGQKWAAATTANAEVAFAAAGTAATTYRIGHQVGISSTTPGGTYSTTIVYICTPVY
ncbi:MAG: hypothetical protein JWN01_1148 [Patescibacteria group bacterium]|nr:hypothetical protein [Patescibacteria group bacterium]